MAGLKEAVKNPTTMILGAAGMQSGVMVASALLYNAMKGTIDDEEIERKAAEMAQKREEIF